MMLRILQGASVAMFVLMVVIGAVVLFLAPEKMAAYGQLVGILLPVFFGQVVPALIGGPLTEYVRAQIAKVG